MMSCMWCELQTCHTWLGHVESWRWVCWACGYCFKFSSSISVNILFYRIGFYCESTMLIKTKQKSLQFSCSVVSDSLWPHESQHARPPCLSPTPGVYPNSCPSSPWCHPAISSSVVPFSSCPQSFPTSGFFSNELALLIRWPEYWSFSFSVCSSNEYSGLISFRIDWFDLLSVQGTLKNLLQHHSLKASILWHSAFFMVQLSHAYMTPGKTMALTR